MSLLRYLCLLLVRYVCSCFVISFVIYVGAMSLCMYVLISLCMYLLRSLLFVMSLCVFVLSVLIDVVSSLFLYVRIYLCFGFCLPLLVDFFLYVRMKLFL